MKYKSDRLLNRKPRVWEVDFLRGLAIILMCVDHLFYDLGFMNGFFVNFDYSNETLVSLMNFGYIVYTSEIRNFLHYIFATVFLLITGVSCVFTGKKWWRVIQFFAIAIILSCVTALLQEITGMTLFISFGVIHCMAVSLFVCALLDYLPGDGIFHLLLGTAVIVLGFAVKWYDAGWVSFPPTANLTNPTTFKTFIEVVLGLSRAGGDHFGLLPCLGVVLVGSYIGKKFYRNKKSLLPALDGAWNSAYRFIGKNTLWVYLAHQVVIAGIVVLIGLSLGMEIF